MARIRTIKPEFFKNEDLAELPFAVRLLFAGLWTQADREGRMEDRPKRLKADLFPYDEVDMEDLLIQLADRGFIVRYEVGGVRYIAIPTFCKHQHCHIKESASTIPAPDLHRASTLSARQEGKGRERKGKTLSERAPAAPTPYAKAKALIGKTHEALSWEPPSDQDIKKCLKPDSPVQELLTAYGEDEARAMFLHAHANWAKPPTWHQIYSNRNQIREQMKGGRNGKAPPERTPAEWEALTQ